MPEEENNSIAYTDNILYKSGIFITPGVVFGKAGEGYVRLSLCADLKIIDEAIRRISNIK